MLLGTFATGIVNLKLYLEADKKVVNFTKSCHPTTAENHV